MRTRGRWAARLVWPIRLLLWLITPITVFVRFFFSVASLAEKPVTQEEETAVDVEALLEAGEEEGILEEKRSRPGALGGGVWRQAGARGDDAAAAGVCGARVDDAGAIS